MHEQRPGMNVQSADGVIEPISVRSNLERVLSYMMLTLLRARYVILPCNGMTRGLFLSGIVTNNVYKAVMYMMKSTSFSIMFCCIGRRVKACTT
jgi:hypothetical protein